MVNIFNRKKNKSAANQFTIEFKKINNENWRLTTPSLVRVWQTSDSINHFVKQINEASLESCGTPCYEANDSTLKSRISYLRNHRKLLLRCHKDEESLWSKKQKSVKIDWEELRQFCAKTSNI